MSIKLQPAVSLSSTVTLNDGVVMPIFGLGTYKADAGGGGSKAEDVVSYAIQQGYKMFDTAQLYLNEADVGRAINKSGIKREDVFIVSKVRSSHHGYELTTQAVMESLQAMETPYIDLYLIHSAEGGKNIETYRALVDLKAKGLLRSVGVSNFGLPHIDGLLASGLPPPSVNQFELHVYQRQQKLVDYCLKHGIYPMGFCPLARAKFMDDPDLNRIAKRVNKTVAQVLVRWSVQKGYITIPKSSSPQRIVENSQVFDFELTEEDMQILDSKPEQFVTKDFVEMYPWEA